MVIRSLLLVLTAAAVAMAQPTVPGSVVTPYAGVTDPGALSFASDGSLYVGRDASGSGGGSGDAVRIHRVGPGGTPVEEFGEAAIFDPDGVLVDETGSVSGIPGAVLVCGVEPSGEGRVSAVAPDQTITTVVSLTAVLPNPNYMAFDASGALLVSDSSAPGVFRFPAGGPLAFFLAPAAGTTPGPPVVDGAGRIFFSQSDGTVAVYAADGTLETASFATGIDAAGAVALGPGGPWSTDLYARGPGGTLLRIDALGMATTIGSGFTGITGLAFGPDGALYVAEFDLDRILRVEPPPPTTTSTSVPSTTTTSTTVVTSTTSTSLPSGCDGIPDGPTVASIRCRIDQLLDRVNAEPALGTFQAKLAKKLGIALAKLDEAEAQCAQGDLKKSRKRLQQVAKALAKYGHKLGSLAARKRLDETLRLDFQGAGEAIRPDVSALRDQIACGQALSAFVYRVEGCLAFVPTS
jgi:sugar lactone lactonase YvrE